MTSFEVSAPILLPSSQCAALLDFKPRHHWPEGLPGIAINKYLIAGFGRKLVFNYTFLPNQQTEMALHFQSFYPSLGFIELAKLQSAAKDLPWFPITEIFSLYKIKEDSSFARATNFVFSQTPAFQNWCIDKQIGIADLNEVLSKTPSNLASITEKLVELGPNKEQGLALLRPNQQTELDAQIQALPWPGHSEIRWTRQDNQAGMEIKLFVTSPSDLKKYANSFEKLQELMEHDPKGLWNKH